MKTLILKGLDDDIKEEIKLSFASSTIIRRRLTELIKDKALTADKSAQSKEGYDCPNWAYKQADTQGYKRALSEVLSLLE